MLYVFPQQNGFRQQRSTYDSLHDIQNDILNTFDTKQVLGLVALDMTKAYDTTWHPRLLKKLHKIVCNGNMLNFIKQFLLDRTFQVKINGHLFTTFKQENYVPRGSAISVTLFLVAINDICDGIKNPVKYSLFADGLNIWCCGKNTNIIQPLLQDSISALVKWSTISGYRFSAPKSQSIIHPTKNIQVT